MTSHAKTSIIIPVYNQWDYTNICINCIKNFTHTPIEIIVIDDGSIDNTVEISKKFGADYILMNKPKDFITTTEDERGRKMY